MIPLFVDPHLCQFIYTLAFVCDHKISTCYTSSVTCKSAHYGKIFESSDDVPTPSKVCTRQHSRCEQVSFLWSPHCHVHHIFVLLHGDFVL